MEYNNENYHCYVFYISFNLILVDEIYSKNVFHKGEIQRQASRCLQDGLVQKTPAI